MKNWRGLAATINVFEGHVMFVRYLNSIHDLILLIPKGSDIGKTIDAMSDTNN